MTAALEHDSTLEDSIALSLKRDSRLAASLRMEENKVQGEAGSKVRLLILSVSTMLAYPQLYMSLSFN